MDDVIRSACCQVFKFGLTLLGSVARVNGARKKMSKRKYIEMPQVGEMMPLPDIAQAMLSAGSYVVQVNSNAGEPLGWIDALQLLRGLNDPRSKEMLARDICVPFGSADYLEVETMGNKIDAWLSERGRILPYFFFKERGMGGVLLLDAIMSELRESGEEAEHKRAAQEKAYHDVGEHIPLGIAVCDGEGKIIYANSLAGAIIAHLELTPGGLQELASASEIRTLTGPENRYYNVVAHQMEVDDSSPLGNRGFVLLFTDVTSEYRLMDQLRESREEVELALAVMLPDQRVATRLQAVPEYTDEYDPSTGKIRITGVISQGVYRHVINILRLLAEMFRQGLMELPGMEKNVLVTATIFHDLAKVQPNLKVGDVVNPAEVFEPGHLHALRGAALAEGIYKLDRDAVIIIKYHHHDEAALPPDFPQHLLPMHRFFRLVDGLSAAITRRNANVKMTVDGNELFIVEKNPVPRYNRSIRLDLYTGKTTLLSS